MHRLCYLNLILLIIFIIQKTAYTRIIDTAAILMTSIKWQHGIGGSRWGVFSTAELTAVIAFNS